MYKNAKKKHLQKLNDLSLKKSILTVKKQGRLVDLEIKVTLKHQTFCVEKHWTRQNVTDWPSVPKYQKTHFNTHSFSFSH